MKIKLATNKGVKEVEAHPCDTSSIEWLKGFEFFTHLNPAFKDDPDYKQGAELLWNMTEKTTGMAIVTKHPCQLTAYHAGMLHMLLSGKDRVLGEITKATKIEEREQQQPSFQRIA